MSLFRLAFLLILAAAPAALAAQAFPGAVGWGAQSRGGRGGPIIRVTNLNAAGPGSLRAAIEARGPRIIVFEVGGVIDLGLTTLDINEPFLTIAGQTAPSPGITIIRGGLDVHGHDVIIRHIRIRTGVSGQARRSGWEADALSTVGAYNVIVDHCTMTWALDENLSASGPRFQGQTVADWRRATSHDITFSNNLLAEGISEGSHPKGEHSKGSLIHDNITNILIYRNIYAHNMERSPLLKGGVHAAVINNLIFDPGAQAMHYNLMDLEWADHPHQDGQLSAVGNVLRGGFSTRSDIAFLTIGGVGDLRYFGRDNVAVDRAGPAAADVRPLHDQRGADRPGRAAGYLAGRDRRAAVEPGRDRAAAPFRRAALGPGSAGPQDHLRRRRRPRPYHRQ